MIVKICAMECSNFTDFLAWLKRYVKESKIPAEIIVNDMIQLKCSIITVSLHDTDLMGTRALREKLAALSVGYALRFEMTVTHDN